MNFTQFQVDAAARGVRSSLQNAERLAVTRQHNVVVSFDESHDRLRVLEDVNNNGTADLSERATWFVLEDGVQFARPPAGVNGAASAALVGGDIQDDRRDAEHHLPPRRRGEHRSRGLSDLARAPSRDDFRAITVVQSTGRTDWYKYIGAAWKAGNL